MDLWAKLAIAAGAIFLGYKIVGKKKPAAVAAPPAPPPPTQRPAGFPPPPNQQRRPPGSEPLFGWQGEWGYYYADGWTRSAAGSLQQFTHRDTEWGLGWDAWTAAKGWHTGAPYLRWTRVFLWKDGDWSLMQEWRPWA